MFQTDRMRRDWKGGLVFAAVVVQALHFAVSLTIDQNTIATDTRACLPPYDIFPFCDTDLDLDARVWDLIDRIMPDEIAPLLTAREGGGGSPGPPGNISRLGLPEYDWGVNCLHGVQTCCVRDTSSGLVHCPTSFPSPVNFGASFNQSMYLSLGQVIGYELRTLWLAGATEESAGSGRPHAGLDCWSPNININRDPRWGRNQEVPSEDPYLNGQYGLLHSQGMQRGNDSRYLQSITTIKHWDAYSLEGSGNITRHTFNAIISNFTLQDTYFPAFKASVVQGGAKGVMCSFNSINGVPTCASEMLVNVLRNTWGFDGYITSDTDSINDIFVNHHYVETGPEAACVAIRNGTCDINSGAVYHNSLMQGVLQGNCSMHDVNMALFRSLKIRFELGLFDPIADQPYWHYPLSTVHSSQSRDTAFLSTLESLVLLKNDHNTLPFRLEKGLRVAVIGPQATVRQTLTGNYVGQVCEDDSFSCVPSPLEAIQSLNTQGTTLLSLGISDLTANDTSGFSDAVNTAASADVVVLLLGLNLTIEGERNDRASIDLPYIQHQLAQVIAAVGKPTVLVLIHGGMVAIVEELKSIPAILDAHYPGVQGAMAIAMTIFGQNNHLGGKLPYTMYPKEYVDQIAMTDMEMTSGPGRTYRYYTGTPILPFGFGLSFTSFQFHLVSQHQQQQKAHSTTNTALTPEVPFLSFTTAISQPQLQLQQQQSVEKNVGDDHVTVITVSVSNTGSVTGDEVVLWFVEPKSLLVQKDHPVKKWLFHFERIHLEPSQKAHVSARVSAATFQIVQTESGDRVSTPGEFDIVVSNGVDQNIRIPVLVSGPEVVVEKFPGN